MMTLAPTRVAYLTHSMHPDTGVGSFSSTLVEGMRARGVMPVVLTDENAQIRNRLRLVRFAHIRRRAAACDLVHALDGFPYGTIAALALIGTGVPLVITAIGTGAVQKLSHPLHGALLRWSYRQARAVTAPSRYIARELERAVPGLAVRVINHGVDYAYWGSGEKKEDTPYILSVGSIKPRKGYQVSIPAFARIARTYPTLQYLIVADPAQNPPYFAELERIIRAEQVGGRVVFRSNLSRDDLRSTYQGAELFVLMSQNSAGDVEGFGLAFLEAAAAGLPVVGSRGTGAEDAIDDGVNGFALPADDVGTVASALERILGDAKLRSALQDGSRAFAKRMSWETRIEQYQEVYVSLAREDTL